MEKSLSDGSYPETTHLSGNTRGQLEKGALAPKTHAQELLESAGECPTSNPDKHREKYSWNGWHGDQNTISQGKAGRCSQSVHRLESQTSTQNLHSESQQKVKAIRNSDMSFILPLFAGDVRDSDGRQLGGPESPIHPHSSTVPYFASVDE